MHIEEIQKLKDRFGKAVLLDEPMNKHTTFETGGIAKVFIKPIDIEQLKDIVKYFDKNKVRNLILGCGSNVLISDKGFADTVVVSLFENEEFSKVTIEDDKILCGAGVKVSEALRACLLNSLSGLEFLCGIPGSIGGAVFMNAGAMGEDIGNWIESVDVIDSKGHLKTILRENLNFAYRQGVRGGIIVRVVLKLVKKDLRQIKEKCCVFMKKRNVSQPYGKSAGSIFRNPDKFYAGQLIEEAGLKGLSVGGAVVSEKHANFILNNNNATSKDISDLMYLVQSRVKENSGIWLEPEIKILGDK